MDGNKWFVIGIIAATALILGIIVALNPASPPEAGRLLTDDEWGSLVNDANHVQGPEDAQTTIVEFGDFQCPACASANPALKTFLDGKDNIRYIWHHFPLSQHSFAKPAAGASEAAGVQGKFFEYADELFSNQGEWASGGDLDGIFANYAEALGLDREKFLNDFKDVDTNLIDTDAELGNSLAVNSTPTFFVNRHQLEGIPQSASEWQALVDNIGSTDAATEEGGGE